MNRDLFGHILFEFYFGEKFSTDQWILICEEDGLPGQIETFEKIISDTLKNSNVGEETVQIAVPKEKFEYVNGSPFRAVHVTLQVSINPNKPSFRKAQYFNRSKISEPVLNIQANGKTLRELVRLCCSSLCHELIHAEENDGLRKNGRKDIGDMHATNNYANYLNYIRNGDVEEFKSLFKLLYWSDFAERKAFIGNLYAELQERSDEIYNAESGYKTLRSTEAWKGFERWQQTVDTLNTMKDNVSFTERVLDVYNSVCNDNITDYNKFLDMLNKRWNKMRSSINKKVSRLIYRVYLEKGKLGATIDIEEY